MGKSEYRRQVELDEGWRRISPQIPYIKFKSSWEVQVCPPWLGATARFFVRKTSSDVECSVYLDWFNVLGCFGGKPYWEVHTILCGEPERFELDDVSGVHGCIERKLDLLS